MNSVSVNICIGKDNTLKWLFFIWHLNTCKYITGEGFLFLLSRCRGAMVFTMVRLQTKRSWSVVTRKKKHGCSRTSTCCGFSTIPTSYVCRATRRCGNRFYYWWRICLVNCGIGSIILRFFFTSEISYFLMYVGEWTITTRKPQFLRAMLTTTSKKLHFIRIELTKTSK